MEELIIYLAEPIYSEFLGLSPEVQETCAAMLCVAVPIIMLVTVIAFLILAIMSIFNLLRGRKRDL